MELFRGWSGLMSCSHTAAAPPLPAVSTPPGGPPPGAAGARGAGGAAGGAGGGAARDRLYAVVVHIDWGRSTDGGELGRCAGVGRQ